ncbi:MAG TPA: cyclopropane-fatty-acyl-phospholipid synthase, partial [Gammaproteobacteria bacterium]|nr:cyclopropane-fatty-acyl-phospholipid synthase [Gammaproteobacteria bacterium]
GTLGLGEAYMDGWWDCPRLDEMVCRALLSDIENKIRRNIRYTLFSLWFGLINRQSLSRAFMVGEQHYDLGNDLFQAILDASMSYSCGYWQQASDLATAQEAKMDLICRKLGLQKGMRVLDVGCGFGGLAHWMASRYDVNVTAVTVSKNQAALANTRCLG